MECSLKFVPLCVCVHLAARDLGPQSADPDRKQLAADLIFLPFAPGERELIKYIGLFCLCARTEKKLAATDASVIA